MRRRAHCVPARIEVWEAVLEGLVELVARLLRRPSMNTISARSGIEVRAVAVRGSGSGGANSDEGRLWKQATHLFRNMTAEPTSNNEC